MTDIRLKILNASGKTLALSRPCSDGISLVYMAEYQKGDRIELETNVSGHCFIKFDELSLFSALTQIVVLGNELI